MFHWHFSLRSHTGCLYLEDITKGVCIWKILRRVSRFVGDFCVCYKFVTATPSLDYMTLLLSLT